MPNEDDYRLARNATRYLTTDRVTPPQAETYRRVLCWGPAETEIHLEGEV